MRGIERYYLHKERTPKWVSPSELYQIYKQSKMLGADYHVDHIVPLVHPHVCGLHCPDNMEILEATANISKSNNFWPDMWEEQLIFELPDFLLRPYQYELPL